MSLSGWWETFPDFPEESWFKAGDGKITYLAEYTKLMIGDGSWSILGRFYALSGRELFDLELVKKNSAKGLKMFKF